HEDAVLRISDARLRGREPEELGVEELHIVQVIGGLDVIGVAENVRTESSAGAIIGFGRSDGIDPRGQVAPELVDVRGPREAPAHANDGDVPTPGEIRILGMADRARWLPDVLAHRRSAEAI